MPNTIKTYWNAFVHLCFPHICLQCGSDALDPSFVLCEDCIKKLPYCAFDNHSALPIEKIFWGRTSIIYANALLFFTKDSITQLLIAELKYKQNKKAGRMLGFLMGTFLLHSHKQDQIDFFVPIPMSKQKMRQRGYNQTEIICEGIQLVLNKPILTNIIAKNPSFDSQTKKTRWQRNMSHPPIFTIQNHHIIQSKNILVIDDVITTGATLEAACNCLAQAYPNSISVLSSAYTI